MKIGISGGFGFIGQHTAEVAVERGHEVVIMDHNARRLADVRNAIGDFEVFLGDVRDEVAMRELGAHVDGIIHLAACLGTQETIRHPLPAAETNIVGGLNFLEAVAQYGIAGTYIGVGNHWMQNTYSITKTTVERFVEMFNNERGTHVNVVRAMNAYGERQSVAPPFGAAKVRKIMPSFVCRALTGNPIELYGGGRQISDMVYVKDVALALVKATEFSAEQRAFVKPVEVGPRDSRSMTVRQVANTVQRLVEDMYGFAPISHRDLPMRPGEKEGDRVSANVHTLDMVGMDADDLVPFADGARRTIEWYHDNWLPKYRVETMQDEGMIPLAGGYTRTQHIGGGYDAPLNES